MHSQQLPKLDEVLRNIGEKLLLDATPSGAGPITLPYNAVVEYLGHERRLRAQLELSAARESLSTMPSLRGHVENLFDQVKRAAAPTGTGSLSISDDTLVANGGFPFRLKAMLIVSNPNQSQPIFAPEEHELALS